MNIKFTELNNTQNIHPLQILKFRMDFWVSGLTRRIRYNLYRISYTSWDHKFQPELHNQHLSWKLQIIYLWNFFRGCLLILSLQVIIGHKYSFNHLTLRAIKVAFIYLKRLEKTKIIEIQECRSWASNRR
jgi:hypothetical protein